MKNLMIPVVLILMGTGAAFASKAAKGNAAMITPVYRIDAASGLCEQVNQTCSDIQGDVCTWSADGTTALHDVPTSPTECGRVLFKP
ncbi:DUF6520 family protein [uncultured Chryseobacterium sp.]|uniref:DUF6520 family protein n=1 Tax=uncultured Chryseobacterium sp. TaxID=259322 RepID=UPI00258C85E6|nr:DUF6520 family protein [uncultured Chryseobacterium sp.]